MKKLFTFFAGILISLLLADVAKCQQFSNGEIAVELSDYGRVRIFAPDELTYQIDRFSILVGNDAGGVFEKIDPPCQSAISVTSRTVRLTR